MKFWLSTAAGWMTFLGALGVLALQVMSFSAIGEWEVIPAALFLGFAVGCSVAVLRTAMPKWRWVGWLSLTVVSLHLIALVVTVTRFLWYE